MIYVFHDYEWNEFILNDNIHGAADSWDYLFDDEVPSQIKWEDNKATNSASLADLAWDKTNQQNEENNDNIKTEQTKDNSSSTKDNQVSLEEIMNDLWIDDEPSNVEYEHNNANTENSSDSLIIDVSENTYNSWDNLYTIKEEKDEEGPVLIIEKQNDNTVDESEDDLLSAKTFSFMEEGWVLPTLVPRDQLHLNKSSISSSSYVDNNGTISKTDYWLSDWWNSTEWYADCMTPWWYKIVHWDSVLAYQQMDNAPDICNIERRFCWKWKLSWTYTQQWCSINQNYTYEQRWEAEVTQKPKESRYKTEQNEDWTVTVKEEEIWWSFVLDKPSKTFTEYYLTDNVRPEDEEVDQTRRPRPGCTAPWWEKVEHGMFVQAFKHSNWFSDAPCEAQLRLCTMWELMWSYTESTCKTWDTSFIDWINGSPTRETYSKEKLQWVRDQINNEVNYDKWLRRFSNSDELEKILSILDE